jgi:hypothetical protein
MDAGWLSVRMKSTLTGCGEAIAAAAVTNISNAIKVRMA